MSFEDFWAAYPRRDETPNITGRKKAKEKLDKIVRDGEATWDEIVSGVRLYAHCDNVKKGYVCLPVTWINQARWEDEYDEAPVPVEQKLRSQWTLDDWRDKLGGVDIAFNRLHFSEEKWNTAYYGPRPPHPESKVPPAIQDEYRKWWPDLKVVELFG